MQTLLKKTAVVTLILYKVYVKARFITRNKVEHFIGDILDLSTRNTRAVWKISSRVTILYILTMAGYFPHRLICNCYICKNKQTDKTSVKNKKFELNKFS